MTEYAFPDPHLTHIKGMSLRDYFAAKAMQNVFLTGGDDDERGYIAMHAYAMADAMMKERENDTSTR